MRVAVTEMKEKADEYFVQEGSIVRQIWGHSDTILLIFAGGAAEFALSKSVDWLFFTGKLPADPIGRLFSTVNYAKRIVFSNEKDAYKAIQDINSIHQGLEKRRGYRIPEWAYRDVLFMLIDYSIRAFETLERSLTKTEKEEILSVFNRLGNGMHIPDLPQTFADWEVAREEHLMANLKYSGYTRDLFEQYRKQLGKIRYEMLLGLQGIIVPKRVHELMGFKKVSIYPTLMSGYKLTKTMHLDNFFKDLILPSKYREDIKGLDEKLENQEIR